VAPTSSQMASRTRQKEEARARRIAEERAQAERARRNRRTRLLVGVLVGCVAVVAVAVAISSSGGSGGAPTPTSAAAKQAASTVDSLLSGIPQSGQTLGNPNAKVTVTEYGDLQCPVCKDFALGSENQLIQNEVRSGKAKLVYKSLESATGNGPNPGIFPTQQAAAYAAGQQGKAWNYIELFYHEQGQEGTNYATPAYFDGLARQIPGLNYSQWQSASQNSALTSQVAADQQQATANHFAYTPTLVISGPKGQAQPIVGVPSSYNQLQSAINSVS
jgi:protein-disulfide isomerase